MAEGEEEAICMRNLVNRMSIFFIKKISIFEGRKCA